MAVDDIELSNVDPLAGSKTGVEGSISPFFGDYVSDFLGKGAALADAPYEAYTGPLTAGASELETKAFEGLAGLTLPTEDMGVSGYKPKVFADLTAEEQQSYMNPYLMQALQPQIDEARRQNEIDRLATASRLTKAGAFGGARQAVMDAEGLRSLQANLAGITGRGYEQAYRDALDQFNREQDLGMTAQDKINLYGTEGLAKLADFGATQRNIEEEGITADRLQFEEERDFPYRQVQYALSLLSGMPVAAESYSYMEPSLLANILGGTGGIMSLFGDVAGLSTPTKTIEDTTQDPDDTAAGINLG
jgi:hypothetical protein